jgi:light-regulated signal transduction histidine kinase (bacteriophytochrome)
MNMRFANYLEAIAGQVGPISAERIKAARKIRNKVITVIYKQGHAVRDIAGALRLSEAQVRGVLVRNGEYNKAVTAISPEEFGE